MSVLCMLKIFVMRHVILTHMLNVARNIMNATCVENVICRALYIACRRLDGGASLPGGVRSPWKLS